MRHWRVVMAGWLGALALSAVFPRIGMTAAGLIFAGISLWMLRHPEWMESELARRRRGRFGWIYGRNDAEFERIRRYNLEVAPRAGVVIGVLIAVGGALGLFW